MASQTNAVETAKEIEMAKAKKTTKAAKKTAPAKASPAKAVKAVAAKPTFETAYRSGGGYHSAVMALKALGLGKMHPHAKIFTAVRQVMTKAGTWKAFAAKKGKMTPEEKCLCNVMVTSRKDYGASLAEAGYRVEWDGKKKVAGLFKN